MKLRKRLTTNIFPNRWFSWFLNLALARSAGFHKEVMLKRAMELVENTGLKGDYAEFGVFRGQTFAAALLLSAQAGLRDMKCWAFDSFEGLPSDEGWFKAGAYACGRDQFIGNVRRCASSEMDRVRVVPGWFDRTMHGTRIDAPLAIAWIDCDIYESTVPVLEFLTSRVQSGTLLCFDDWLCLGGDPMTGEIRACREWLDANPGISLVEYCNFGWHGKSFIVQVSRGRNGKS